jgi:hypothetical protein
MAYSAVNPIEDATTDAHAAIAAAPIALPVDLGSTFTNPLKIGHATRAVMIAMFRTFTPSAVTPPSANNNACTMTTTETTTTPIDGPRRMAASAPPSRWPLVPAATGKLSIWRAKMTAADSPAKGICFSRRRAAPIFSDAASPPIETAAAPADVAALMNPSGTCIASFLFATCLQYRLYCEHRRFGTGSRR